MVTRILICGFGVLVMLLAGCAKATVDTQILETAIAAKIFATLTAQAPTITPESSITPPILPTPTRAITPTVLLQATVVPAALNMREGPGTNYPVLLQIKYGDPVTITGGYNRCDWVKLKTKDGKEGWVKAGEGYLTYSVDCSIIPHGTFRPMTGSLIKDGRTGTSGLGQLKVGNGTGSDGLVVLVGENKEPLVAFYVRSMDQFTLNGVPNGNYTLYYARGNDWEGDTKQFQKVDVLIRLDDALKLPLQLIWAVRLDGVSSGTVEPGSAVHTSQITSAQFPVIK